MNVIAVDDEHYALLNLQSAIQEAVSDCRLSIFETSSTALAYAEKQQVDVAFLDIEMGGMSGFELARRLKNIYARTNIVFVTGYPQYALDSYKIDTSDYLLKPVSKTAITSAILRLRNPVDLRAGAKIYVQTFGNFEIFVNGKPLTFTRSKTRELLAYLVDRRGALCTSNEIVAVLWPEKEDSLALQNYFRQLVADLTNTLKKAGILDIVIKQRGRLAICPDTLTCDLYEFDCGKTAAANRYAGEYMAQYSWAEITNARLERTAADGKFPLHPVTPDAACECSSTLESARRTKETS